MAETSVRFVRVIGQSGLDSAVPVADRARRLARLTVLAAIIIVITAVLVVLVVLLDFRARLGGAKRRRVGGGAVNSFRRAGAWRFLGEALNWQFAIAHIQLTNLQVGENRRTFGTTIDDATVDASLAEDSDALTVLEFVDVVENIAFHKQSVAGRSRRR